MTFQDINNNVIQFDIIGTFCPYPSNLEHINFQNILHPIHFAKHAKN
jgi:hypothetical protein